MEGIIEIKYSFFERIKQVSLKSKNLFTVMTFHG